MKLNNESKTLFIPLYGKAMMSKNNLFLYDKKAEEIVDSINYDFTNLKQSRWLSMYMALRASIIDEMCNQYMEENSHATIVHLGCGLDSRTCRINQKYHMWYDIDFESVIDLRKHYYQENEKYKMIGKSVTDLSWLQEIDNASENILIIAEGLTMYLSEDEMKNLVAGIQKRFGEATLLFDAYSKTAVKASKYKNPVNKMNASVKWGMNRPVDFGKLNEKIEFVQAYPIRRKDTGLKGVTKFIFENVYCGILSQPLYKIYKSKLGK